MPGLIEGAADGAGLGHEFLAHLERARLLIHVLDASESDLEDRFRTIDRELSAYGAGLDERPQIVVLNKIDLLRPHRCSSSETSALRGSWRLPAPRAPASRSSSSALFELCSPESAAPVVDDSLPDFLEYRPKPRRGPRFRILRTDRGYRVVGTPPPAPELEEALRRAGVKRGAEVELEEETLEWQ